MLAGLRFLRHGLKPFSSPKRLLCMESEKTALYCVASSPHVEGVCESRVAGALAQSVSRNPALGGFIPTRGSSLEGVPRAEDAFNFGSYFSKLRTQELGKALVYAPVMESTQAFNCDHMDYLDGVTTLTDVQTNGKGRNENQWDSPNGCLMVSFTLPITDGSRLPFFQYLITLGVVKAASSFPGLDDGDIQIKWPNDVYSGRQKIGGVLCQSRYVNGSFNVVTGVGVNVTNSNPTTSLQNIASAKNEESNITREDFLAEFFNVFEPMYSRFLFSGFVPFEQDYYHSWLHSGQEVVIQQQEEEEEHSSVFIRGLTKDGYLLAEDKFNNGQMYQLHPDGNSFDFFSGLVKKKL